MAAVKRYYVRHFAVQNNNSVLNGVCRTNTIQKFILNKYKNYIMNKLKVV